MPHKDPAKQKEYTRDWARRNRSKVRVSTTSSTSNALTRSFKLSSVEELTRVLECAINDLMAATDLDAAVRARVAAQIVNSATRLLEVGSIEDRLTELENLAKAKKRNNNL